MPYPEPTPPAWRLPLAHPRPDLEPLGRPWVLGIVNITPDSFSDGGRYIDPGRAVEHGRRLVAEGADILDLGAESTRPGGGVYGEGSDELEPEEELARLLPVLDALRRELPAVPISIDTRKGAVARQGLAHGADLVNDVGGLADAELRAAVAEAGCPVIAMHSRGELRTMQKTIRFDDVVAEVGAEMAQMVELAESSGIDPRRVILDPGIGFGKTRGQNLALVRRLDAFAELGRPLLLGASRKSFLTVAGPAPPDRRLGGSLAAIAWALTHRIDFVRVHDVAETVQLVGVWNAINSADGDLEPSADRNHAPARA